MRAAAELKKFVREARTMLARERDLAEFEIYCALAEHRVARINYTSDIPSRGVEELKSHVADGFTVRIVMRRDAHEIGTATEAGDLSLEALRAALVRARSAALVDPHFPGLPGTPRKLSPNSAGPADAAAGGLMRASDALAGRSGVANRRRCARGFHDATGGGANHRDVGARPGAGRRRLDDARSDGACEFELRRRAGRDRRALHLAR